MHITPNGIIAIIFLASLVVGCLASIKDLIRKEYYGACLLFFVGMFGTWLVGLILIATSLATITLTT